MKINYNNTALGILEDTLNYNFYVPEETSPSMSEQEKREFGLSVLKAMQHSGMKKEFKKNIKYVTKPFYEAYIKSRNKVRQVVLKEKLDIAGTLIIPFNTHVQTIFYYLNTNGKDSEDFEYSCLLAVFTKTPKLKYPGLDVYVSVDGNTKDMREVIWEGFVKENRDSTWWIAEMMLFRTFLNIVEVETKIVNAERKEHHCGEKYVNETKRNIEILDSTYFTTISRTEGFGVHGHFRWQPCGTGRSDKKLIWISDFEKHGYTRKAKIAR